MQCRTLGRLPGALASALSPHHPPNDAVEAEMDNNQEAVQRVNAAEGGVAEAMGHHGRSSTRLTMLPTTSAAAPPSAALTL